MKLLKPMTPRTNQSGVGSDIFAVAPAALASLWHHEALAGVLERVPQFLYSELSGRAKTPERNSVAAKTGSRTRGMHIHSVALNFSTHAEVGIAHGPVK